jgi:hypothetical protein
MPPAFRTLDNNDVEISKLVGLETYKALYALYPNLYSYISNPLVPTNYFVTLVSGVITNSTVSFDQAGQLIYDTLVSLTRDQEVAPENLVLVTPLLNSSYTIKNLSYTNWENIIWITITIFLAFFIIWYLYVVGFWTKLFDSEYGIACYDCPSMFDMVQF